MLANGVSQLDETGVFAGLERSKFDHAGSDQDVIF